LLAGGNWIIDQVKLIDVYRSRTTQQHPEPVNRDRGSSV